MKLNVDKIFCCHHPSPFLERRKPRLLDFFSENDLEVEWVEGFPPEDAIKWEHDSLLQAILTRGPEHCRGNLKESEDLCGRQISLILKHNYCCDSQLKNGYENILVLEDDVDLFSFFSEEYFNGCIKEFKEQDLELLFMGSCCDLHYPNIKSNQYVYQHDSLMSRCTHCYVLNIEGAKKLSKHCYEMIDAIDWQFNWIIKEEKIKNSWAEPSIEQIEEYGSTLI